MSCYIIMNRDIRANDVMEPDVAVYVTDSESDCEYKLAGLCADESENDFYYMVTVRD